MCHSNIKRVCHYAEGWLARVPGRVFLCAHVVARHTEPEQYKLFDDNDLWNELQTVTNAIGWENYTTAWDSSTHPFTRSPVPPFTRSPVSPVDSPHHG